MRLSPLNPDNHPAALAYLRAAPYRNALPLSNATQLHGRCDVLVALPMHGSESGGCCFERADGTRVAWTSPWRYRVGPRYGPLPADACSTAAPREYGKFGWSVRL